MVNGELTPGPPRIYYSTVQCNALLYEKTIYIKKNTQRVQITYVVEEDFLTLSIKQPLLRYPVHYWCILNTAVYIIKRKGNEMKWKLSIYNLSG